MESGPFRFWRELAELRVLARGQAGNEPQLVVAADVSFSGCQSPQKEGMRGRLLRRNSATRKISRCSVEQRISYRQYFRVRRPPATDLDRVRLRESEMSRRDRSPRPRWRRATDSVSTLMILTCPQISNMFLRSGIEPIAVR